MAPFCGACMQFDFSKYVRIRNLRPLNYLKKKKKDEMVRLKGGVRGMGTLFGALLLLLFVGTAYGAREDRPLWVRYPAVSPDGRNVAFCYRGVLFVVPTAGGEARALTTGTDYAAGPIWSPDGKQIAYEGHRYGNADIFLLPIEGGAPTRLTTHSTWETPLAFNAAGDSIYFRAMYTPDARSGGFYTGWTKPLYRMSIKGGDPVLQLTHPLAALDVSKDGKRVIFEDLKGNEDPFRKHHVSSITRDIWSYDKASGKVSILIERPGEDRNPIFSPDGSGFYFLSERDGGSMNVYKATLANPTAATAITSFEKNPVRNLTSSSDGLLCFSYDGEIYTMREGAAPQRLSVSVNYPNEEFPVQNITYRRGADEASLSPDGKEVALVVRGDIFVTSVEYGVTRRITNTPTQERSVSFSPDGRTLVYAGERDGSWNLYTTKITRKEEPNFSGATELTESVLLKNGKQNFQPLFSPDGKEVAFLQDRTKLMVINVASKAVREITDGSQNYSYADGDLSFDWSPDGKWLTLDYVAKKRWPNNDIGVVSAAGGQPIINITQSGYTEGEPKFMMNGDMIMWFSDRLGLRQHASWGAQQDVFAFFTTKEAYDKFMRSKFEDDLAKSAKDEKDDEASEDDSKGKKDKKGKKKDDGKAKKDEKKSIKIEFDRPEDRIVRLTVNSASISDALVTPDGKSLYYLAQFEDRYNLWKVDLKEREAKKVLNLEVGGGSLSFDKDAKNILVATGSSLIKVKVSDHSRKNVSYAARFELRAPQEREYMFEHAWQQVKDKFYRSDIHGVDWNYYHDTYKKFLPHINNNYDFADMLSEMLGELNASHTGSGYRGSPSEQPAITASLGLFYDANYKGKGLKVTEVLIGGPFDKAASKVKPGTIITRIDGEEVESLASLPALLDRMVGERVRVDYQGGSEVVKPISLGEERNLLYNRWVDQRRKEVDSLSKGRLGYVHVRSMDGDSYRAVYEGLFGRYNDREGVVIDTRYNGGGHLHEDIEVLFSGTKYLDQVPREHMVSEQPRKRWKKPSVMLIGEANYSNAHGTPWVYKTQKVGKLVGMPVPGTMTSVWWETQIDRSLYFGVPIVGYVDANGNYLENQQLEPDVKVRMDYQKLSQGHDTQLEKAVEVLLQECDSVKATSPWTAIDAKYSK